MIQIKSSSEMFTFALAPCLPPKNMKYQLLSCRRHPHVIDGQCSSKSARENNTNTHTQTHTLIQHTRIWHWDKYKQFSFKSTGSHSDIGRVIKGLPSVTAWIDRQVRTTDTPQASWKAFLPTSLSTEQRMSRGWQSMTVSARPWAPNPAV